MTNNRLVLRPMEKRYTLEELLAQCDLNASEVSEQEVWGTSEPVGDEVC